MITQAMVLAAGLGTRMMPLTRHRPKPTLPVLNKPLIVRLLEHLSTQGVTFAVVNSHHLAERLESEVAAGAPPGMQVEFSREEKTILGTAGGLRKALGRFRREPLYLINSDSLTDADLAVASRAHARSERAATLIVREHDPAEGYRPVLTAPADSDPERTEPIVGLAGRRFVRLEEAPVARTFTGIHILERGVAESIPKGVPCDIVTDTYVGLLEEDQDSVGAWLHRGFWYEAGSPARYLDLNLLLLARSGRSATIAPGFFLDEEARIDRAVVGERARVEGGSRIERSVLWEDVTVGAEARLTRCIVTQGVSVPAGSAFEEAILMRSESGELSVDPLERRR